MPLFFVVLAMLLAFPEQALAYLDPGTGSILIQVTIGALAAGLAVCRLYWRKITQIFRKTEESPD
jgi:hypothetical protein